MNKRRKTIENDAPVQPTNWKDLFTIGGIACLLVAFMVLVAIAAYFIWPYTPHEKTTAEIFSLLQDNPWGGLISLDLLMPIIAFINVFPMLALYAALKRVNPSYALIALVIGLLAVAAILPARPLVEMQVLSEKYARAATATEKTQLIAAGEVFRTLFDGTAWLFQTILLLAAGLINAVLMQRSKIFNRKLAWLGILTAIVGFGFPIPAVGLVFLLVNTVLTIPFSFWTGLLLLREARA